MEKLLKLLTEAESAAKQLADADPRNSAKQVLRARVHHALEFAASPACAEPKAEAKTK